MITPTTIEIFQEIISIAGNETNDMTCAPSATYDISTIADEDFPQFNTPTPLTPNLVDLGLPIEIAERMSSAYLCAAEKLKLTAEANLRSTYSKLASLPRCTDGLPLERLQRRILGGQNDLYEKTLSKWATDVTSLALNSLAHTSSTPSLTPAHAASNFKIIPSRKTRRKFKTEYLPLFEFAFEKDRFPNREDKRQLAKISGMSYRQVCVWFQNRRCRHAARVKAHHLTPPPQTFEEMKERLSASARNTLSKSLTASKKSSQSLSHASSSFISVVQDVTGPQVLACDLKDEETALARFRARSPGISEVPHSEERDELEVGDYMLNTPQPTLALYHSPELVLRPLNPLDSHKLTTANVFPAVYKPSKPTNNPFIVKPQTWLRSIQAPGTAQVIDPTPEVLESIIEEFDKMEVDIPMFDSDSSLGSLTTHKDPVPSALPHTNVLSFCTPLNSHISMPRTISSGSSVSWSSDSSTPSSRSASYSTAPSSVLSSPNRSEICLPNQSECGIAPSRLTAPSPSADEESTCHTPVHEVASRAGPFDVSSSKPASKARVDEWVSGVSAQPEDDHAANKWQQLLAAAAAEASPAT